MLIEQKNRKSASLEQSEIVSSVRGRMRIPLRRRVRMYVTAACYKYFVPTGLVPLTIAVIIFTIAMVNWRVHGEALIAPNEAAEQQMQMPADLDYSKFLHSNTNHARLPCLLCHRRD